MVHLPSLRFLVVTCIFAVWCSFYFSPSPTNAEEKQTDAKAKDLPLSPAVVKRLEDLKTAGKKDLADKLSQEIREAWETACRYKQGHVIVGQVKLADGKKDVRLVDAQMVILEEGLFAGEVRDLERPVGFALQGYLPAELQLKGKNGNIVDVGEIILQPLTQEKSSSLKAKISTESGSASEVSMKLAVSRGAINTPHNGYSPRGAPGWETPTELRPDNEGRVAGSNLSPGKYSVTVSAPGHINQSRAIDLQPGQLFDLGEIRLLEELSGEKKPVDFWEISYGVALEKAKKETKPLFVMLTTKNCGWCKKLEKDTLSLSTIQEFLGPFIKVQVYADKDQEQGELAKKLGAGGYPTLVFLNSDETLLNRFFGYRAPTAFALECAKAFEKAKIPQPEELKKLVEKEKKNSG